MKFKIGDKVKIIKTMCGHKYIIGDVVYITEINHHDSYSVSKIKGKTESGPTSVHVEEIELIKDNKGFEDKKSASDLGIDTTKKFILISDNGKFRIGNIVELKDDDDTSCPTFKSIHSSLEGFINWRRLKYYDEEPILTSTAKLTGSASTLTTEDVEQIVKDMQEKKEHILKPNNTIMRTIEKDALDIETTEYFENKKNTEVIRKADKEISELLDILNEAASDIGKKYTKVRELSQRLNARFTDKNITIKETLAEFKEVKEFINIYNKNTIKQLGTVIVEKEAFDVTEYFNK